MKSRVHPVRYLLAGRTSPGVAAPRRPPPPRAAGGGGGAPAEAGLAPPARPPVIHCPALPFPAAAGRQLDPAVEGRDQPTALPAADPGPGMDHAERRGSGILAAAVQ